MAMNRRNVLIGLGAIAAGGGTAFGSGAFSSMEADRTMTVAFSDDSTAEVSLDPTSTYATTETANDSPNGASTLLLEFGNLNDNAVSTFSGVFDIINNDSEGSSHSVYIANQGDVDGTKIDFRDSSGNSIVGSGNAVSLGNGNAISVAVSIDSRTAISSSVTVTVVAE